ncbi:putative cytochrome P450 12a4-like protein [Leptotrombidium deliense]|uniref:Putative cytochrome P450 12a4-like protein n=1 Tax=Leptotrombidium deliense TaxID=299467 RepID=A0A443SVB2_9ACAR|nr:putative cytochrome P450 12a4-like protein [Leptotrombidium deliense]
MFTALDLKSVIKELFSLYQTSFTCGFALYFLAKNPKIQEAVRDEIKTFLPQKSSKVKPDAVHSMHLLKACVKETMR